ncbi:MAG: hypothetical protein Kapaf2KO_24040 [Candidatus Kapaibacteriales bacterium]
MGLTDKQLRIVEMANHLLKYEGLNLKQGIQELRQIWHDAETEELEAAYRLATW